MLNNSEHMSGCAKWIWWLVEKFQKIRKNPSYKNTEYVWYTKSGSAK